MIIPGDRIAALLPAARRFRFPTLPYERRRATLAFEDEGYSGASLIRPGLERVRDLAAEGQLDAVLVYARIGSVDDTPIRSS